jgi:hypothetical protein
VLKPAAFLAAACVLVLLIPGLPFLAGLGLRAFITAAAVLVLLYLGAQRELLWATFLGVVAVLFNPIVHIRPDESTLLGIVVHIAAALTLAGAGLQLCEEEAPPPPGPELFPEQPAAPPPSAPRQPPPQRRPPQWRRLG